MSILKETGYQWMSMQAAQDYIPDITNAEECQRLFPYFEGTWCKYIFAATYFNQIEDTVLVTHGPLSCVASAKNFKQTNYSLFAAEPFAYMPCTGLDELMLIMGEGESQLEETLRRVDRVYRPKLMVVMDTCSGYMIGDDIQGVVDRIQDELEAQVIYTPSPGFSGVPYGPAKSSLAPYTVDIMEPADTIDQDAVNVLGLNFDSGILPSQGRKYAGEVLGYYHLIEGLGLKVHRTLIFGNPEYIQTAPMAGVNAIHSGGWGYPIAREMEKRFGTPWLKRVHPSGMGPIRRWVEELAEFTGRQAAAERFLKSEEAKLMPLYEQARKALAGKVLLVECSRNAMARFTDTMAYGRLGQDLGMKPVLFNCHPVEFKGDQDDVDSFIQDGFNADILIGPYPYQSPVNVTDVMDDLGLDADQCVYIYDVIFPFARAGSFDPCNVARYSASFDMKRVKGGSYRSAGYSGTAQTYKGMLEAVKVAQRKTKPTLYGRVFSNQPLEYGQALD